MFPARQRHGVLGGVGTPKVVLVPSLQGRAVPLSKVVLWLRSSKVVLWLEFA